MSATETFEDYRIAIDEQHNFDTTFCANTPNATSFSYLDAPLGYRKGARRESYQDWYKRLWGYQTGLYNGWWEDSKRHNELEKAYLLDIISGQLELTPGQRAEARQLLKTVITDMRRYNARYARVRETVVVALCAYVSTKDNRSCHPNHKKRDDLFNQLKADIGIKPKHYKTVYGRLEQDILKARSEGGL